MSNSNLSKAQWQHKITEIAKNLPQDLRPDDQTIAHILVDVIVSEQSKLSDKNLTMLAGLAAALLERVKSSIPAATHVLENGEKVYTEAEIAAHLGISLEEVRKLTLEMQQEQGSLNGDLVCTDVDPRSLHRIN
jgi:hypothetical protein